MDETTKILGNISEIFEGFPGAAFVLDTAKKFLVAMRSTEELKEILRWQSNKVILDIDGQAVGIEVHYKLNIVEETKKNYIMKNETDTIFMVAYKTLAHSMKVQVGDIPSWDKLKNVQF